MCCSHSNPHKHLKPGAQGGFLGREGGFWGGIAQGLCTGSPACFWIRLPGGLPSRWGTWWHSTPPPLQPHLPCPFPAHGGDTPIPTVSPTRTGASCGNHPSTTTEAPSQSWVWAQHLQGPGDTQGEERLGKWRVSGNEEGPGWGAAPNMPSRPCTPSLSPNPGMEAGAGLDRGRLAGCDGVEGAWGPGSQD